MENSSSSTGTNLSSVLGTLLNTDSQTSHEGSGAPHRHRAFFESWEFIILSVIVFSVILSFIIVVFCIMMDKIVKYFQRRKTRAEIMAYFQKYWKVEVCRNCWGRPATLYCNDCHTKYFCASCSDAIHRHNRDRRCCSAWRTSLSKHEITPIRKNNPNEHENSAGGGGGAAAAGNQSVPGTPRWNHRRSGSKAITFRSHAPTEDGAVAGIIDAGSISAASSSLGNTDQLSSQSSSPFSSSPLGVFSSAAPPPSVSSVKGFSLMGGVGTTVGALPSSSSSSASITRGVGITEGLIKGGYLGSINAKTVDGSHVVNKDVTITVREDDSDDSDDDDNNDGNNTSDYDGEDEDDMAADDNGNETAPLLKALGASTNSYTTFRTLIDEDGYDSS